MDVIWFIIVTCEWWLWKLIVSLVTDLEPDFQHMDKNQPNCVVIGDATHNFSYQNLNAAFQTLIALDKPVLISMGQGYEVTVRPLLN